MGSGHSNNACVLLSGGVDSVAALHWALAKYPSVRAIGFDYGQPNRDAECTAAGRIAKGLGISYALVVIADALRPEKPLGLLRGVEAHDPASTTLNRAFVPARNIAFLSMAAAHSCSWFHGSIHLVIGANRDDAAGFPDCRVTVLQEMGRVLRLGCAREIQVVAPFLDWSKDLIVAHASPEARADIARSWSCYRGDGPCGECTACVLRAHAFSSHGIVDAAARPVMFGGDPHRAA